jgi:tubulin--tyrosine ligase
LYTRILALFAAAPYAPPAAGAAELDLLPHLTNTSLQTERGEENVRLLSELAGCHILSGSGDDEQQMLAAEDIESIIGQMSTILAETFKAALEMPIHFQVASCCPSLHPPYISRLR